MTGTKPGTLYLVPNLLGDSEPERVLPPQVRGIVHSLEHFIVETPKAARAYLKRVGTARPLQELHIEALPEKPADADLRQLLKPLAAGHDVGLISDAGVPAVADPGALVARAAHGMGARVVPLVGPSSLLLALMASGLNGQRFAFHGYLPVDERDLTTALRALEAESARLDQTQLFIETPYRNPRMLRLLTATLKPGTLVCVATDLSLASEAVITRSVREWRAAAAMDIKDRPSVFLLLAAAVDPAGAARAQRG